MPMFIKKGKKHGKTCKISRYRANPNYPLVYNSTSRAFCGKRGAYLVSTSQRILGLILKPYPIQIILLSVLAASALFIGQCKRYFGRLWLHSIVDDHCSLLLERCIW